MAVVPSVGILCCKVDVNSTLRENSRKSSSSSLSTLASLDDDSDEKTVNVNKVCRQ